MEIDAVDQAMMVRCIELSKSGAASGELPFGSLIARQGQIIAEATNEIVRHADESRHAEIVAIARARQLLGDEELSNQKACGGVSPFPPIVRWCLHTEAMAGPNIACAGQQNITVDKHKRLCCRLSLSGLTSVSNM